MIVLSKTSIVIFISTASKSIAGRYKFSTITSFEPSDVASFHDDLFEKFGTMRKSAHKYHPSSMTIDFVTAIESYCEGSKDALCVANIHWAKKMVKDYIDQHDFFQNEKGNIALNYPVKMDFKLVSALDKITSSLDHLRKDNIEQIMYSITMIEEEIKIMGDVVPAYQKMALSAVSVAKASTKLWHAAFFDDTHPFFGDLDMNKKNNQTSRIGNIGDNNNDPLPVCSNPLSNVIIADVMGVLLTPATVFLTPAFVISWAILGPILFADLILNFTQESVMQVILSVGGFLLLPFSIPFAVVSLPTVFFSFYAFEEVRNCNSGLPTKVPTPQPSGGKLIITTAPSPRPTTAYPTNFPTRFPTIPPSRSPTKSPTRLPTPYPSIRPTRAPVTSSPTRPLVWTQRGSNLNGNAGDEMGAVVNMSNNGKTIAASSSGFVGITRVYEWRSGSWTHTMSYQSRESVTHSVSIASTVERIVCGNPLDDDGRGRVVSYYKTASGSWSREGGTSVLKGESANDRFGRSLSISDSGLKLSVGADGGEYVKIFVVRNRQWSLRYRFDNENGGAQDGYGMATSMSQDGRRLVVGVPWRGDNTGRVVFYDLKLYSEIQVEEGSSVYAYFGADLSLSEDGSRAVVGAFGRDYVKLFRHDDGRGKYVKIGQTIKFDRGNRFGCTVAISGDGRRIAIGARYASVSGKKNTGKVFIYDVGDQNWNRIHVINGESSYDQLGTSAALSEDGRNVIVGAALNDGGGVKSGQVVILNAN